MLQQTNHSLTLFQVFPLLGVFYAVIGGLYPLLDDLFTPKPPEPSPEEQTGPGILLATWGPTDDADKKEVPPWEEVAPPFQFM
jgi:hypothetical protein